MIASHRTPATGLMTVGGFLFLLGLFMPFVFRPDTPQAILVASLWMQGIAVPIFATGCCIYSKGIGYPFWLGFFGFTLVGLLVLMFLPDRCLGAEEEDEMEQV